MGDLRKRISDIAIVDPHDGTLGEMYPDVIDEIIAIVNDEKLKTIKNYNEGFLHTGKRGGES